MIPGSIGVDVLEVQDKVVGPWVYLVSGARVVYNIHWIQMLPQLRLM